MQRIADFLAYLTVEKGSSAHTIQAYKNDLHQLVEFLTARYQVEAAPGVINWPAVRKAQLIDYALYLRSREYTTSTVARKIATVRSFFHFLAAEGVCRKDPSLSLDTPRVTRRLPQVLTVEQVVQLLLQPTLMPAAEALRDALMFHLVFDGNLHVTEVINLNLSDVDLAAGCLRYYLPDDSRPENVAGLGRTVFLGQKAVQALRDYLETARPALADEGGGDEPALFINERGHRFSEAGFWMLVSKHAEAKRDRAMLELLYATGMRASELVALNEQDVNLTTGYVRCLGKGQKERIIPIHRQAIESLQVYLNEGRPQLLNAGQGEGGGLSPDERALFLNNRGGRLTRQGLWLIIKHYARNLGLEDQVTPHTLRHTFATHMLNNKAELRAVQKLLGHASITTTQIYTHLSREHIHKVYDASHPRAR